MAKSSRVSGTRITSISLDDETFQIKETLIKSYGFSSWIRECLRRYALEHQVRTGTGDMHVMEEEKRVRGLCNGLNPNLCPTCWPKGRPSRADWLRWVQGELDEKPEPLMRYFPLPTEEPQKESNETPMSDQPHKGILRRFLRWLW